jgi:hypothetical protein
MMAAKTVAWKESHLATQMAFSPFERTFVLLLLALMIDLEQKMAADSAQMIASSHGNMVPISPGRHHCFY